MNKKDLQSVLNISAVSLFCCSTLFFIMFVPVSPFYVGVGLTFVFLFMTFSCNVSIIRFKKSHSENFLFLISLFYISYVTTNSCVNQIPLKYPLLFSFSVFLYFCSKILFSKINVKILNFSIKNFIFFNTCLLIFDFIYRILHPTILDWDYSSNDFFYMFKSSSIIFSDTNEVGFMVLIIITFLYTINGLKFVKINKISFIVFFILLVLTFSRAAVLAYLLLLFFCYIRKKNNGFFLFLLLAVIFVFLLFFSIENISDYSLQTKFDIFLRTIKYLSKVDVSTFLFGIGFAQSEVAIGVYGHNYITLFLIEFGFIGLVLFLLL